MTEHDMQPIIRRMVIYLRQVEDCLQRAGDQLDDQNLALGELSYAEAQILKANEALGRAMNCVEELPTGAFSLAATASAGEFNRRTSLG